ncbi:hypothetical protein [Erythrobacter donghaensis]|uniref:hypothetical protein n=1 Tax=Erythrobacter donghaensis TaxID=267135 RepID=UPI001E600E14|nr:hypothetical protein [Erythrobacter donghaensis]
MPALKYLLLMRLKPIAAKMSARKAEIISIFTVYSSSMKAARGSAATGSHNTPIERLRLNACVMMRAAAISIAGNHIKSIG